MGSIFYAWLSDRPNRSNWGLIKEALEDAIRRLNADLVVDECRDVVQRWGLMEACVPTQMTNSVAATLDVVNCGQCHGRRHRYRNDTIRDLRCRVIVRPPDRDIVAGCRSGASNVQSRGRSPARSTRRREPGGLNCIPRLASGRAPVQSLPRSQ